METTQSETYGEQKVKKLLDQFQRAYADRFFFQQEYRIQNANRPSTRPDFVAVMAEYGVVVVEVKDWVKINEATQKQVVLQRKDGQLMVEENPIITAQNYAYDLSDALNHRVELCAPYKGKQALKFPYQPMVILTNISNGVIKELEAKGVFDKGVAIGAETLATPEAFYAALKQLPWRFRIAHPLDKLTLDTLRGVLNPTLVVTDSAGRDIGTATRMQESLITETLPSQLPHQTDLFQQELLSQEAQAVMNSQTIRLVRGVAGSGKTLVLVKRAQFLQQQYPDSRIALLTFNTDLRDSLRQRFPEININNFHKICKQIIGDGWHSPQQSGGWIRKYAGEWIKALELPDHLNAVDYIEEEMGWRKELGVFKTQAYLAIERQGRQVSLNVEKRKVMDQIFQAYWAHQLGQRKKGEDWMDWEDVPYMAMNLLEETKDHPMLGAYDAILIDEAQDFAPSWLQVVKLLLKPHGSLFLCDDPTQSLFRYFSWRQKGVEVVGRTRVLRVPFRCTRQINQTAYSLILEDALLSKSDEITHPDLNSRELNEGSQPVLYKVQTVDEERQLVESEVRRLLEEGYAPNEIAVLCHRKGMLKHYAHLRDVGGFDDKVYVENFERMKGLEFRAVILPEISSSFANANEEEGISQVRRKLFTAMTRARELLVMTYSAEQPLPPMLEPILPHVWREAL